MGKRLTEFDTIAAISTPVGEGGISIVRLSGEDAVAIANRVFQKKDLSKVASHTIHYGHIVDPTTNEVIDEVMVSVMLAPKTYTREDVIEINSHGGMIVTNRVLQVLLQNGARMAEPGEFTKRAFMNGRIDLTQAEGVMDLIRAKTEKASQVASNQLQGALTKAVKALRQEILDTLANVEVNIDYPEYDAETVTAGQMQETSQSVIDKIDELLKTSSEGTILRNGLKTAIIGRPNVGKSSLLNYLAKSDKAIVTDIAGTTRDTLEEYVSVNGVPLRLIDTAGIRETSDLVEKIGVERSKKALSEADLVFLLINSSEKLTEEDRELLALTQDKKRIIVLNKTDLPRQVDSSDLATDSPIVEVSILNGDNVKEIGELLQKLFFSGIRNSADEAMVTNQRQISLLNKAKMQLQEAIDAVDNGVPLDIAQIDFTGAWETLGEITGESAPDELITTLFSQFCLGK
ncbi:MAG: tRNA uridine-5-carboxymethylaminomethyl(34) synthesis GTPase MnmE [Lactobacillus sp.]|nr:tRNA uridine-5-carboxymethylaminomethyl(34) synthesis GTPase MnmE [Lactobacillus sp.]